MNALNASASLAASRPTPAMLVDVPRLRHGLLHGRAGSFGAGRSGSRSAPRGIAAPRSRARSTSGTYWPSARPSATTASSRASTARCFSASTRMRCRCRPAPARSRCWRPTASKSCSRTTTNTRPTPVISHAILTYNRGRQRGLADGIVITPSHNPPDNGGFKYNPPNGGPADTDITGWIEARANDVSAKAASQGVKRIPHAQGVARRHHAPARLSRRLRQPISATCSTWMRSAARTSAWASIRSAAPAFTTGARLPSATGSNLTVVNDAVDPTFRFMTLDWDGRIRMDPSSPYAMQRPDRPQGPLRHRLRLRHRP